MANLDAYLKFYTSDYQRIMTTKSHHSTTNLRCDVSWCKVKFGMNLLFARYQGRKFRQNITS